MATLENCGIDVLVFRIPLFHHVAVHNTPAAFGELHGCHLLLLIQ